MMKRSISTRSQNWSVLLVLTCLITLCCNSVWAGGSGSSDAGAAYQIYSPKHISIGQAKHHLLQLGIGTVSQLPGTHSLLITACPDDLKKIKGVLNGIDRVKGAVPNPLARPHKFAANEAITESNDKSIESLKSTDLDRTTDSNRPAQAQPDQENVEAPVLKQLIPSRQALKAIPATAGEQIYKTPDIPNSDQTLKLSLPEKLSVVSLLELVGEHLQLTYIYDPKLIVGDVTLKLQGALRGPIKVKELYPLLESVLKFKGFVMSRRGNVVTVVPVGKVMEIDPDLIINGGEIEYGDTVLTRVFKLKHIDTASAESLLQSMSLGMSKVSVAETKTLIITAYAYRMPRIESILDIVDRPGEPKLFRARQLQYTTAKNLTEKVRALAEQLDTMDISVSSASTSTTARPTKRTGESTTAYSARLRAWSSNVARAKASGSSRTSTKPKQDAVYLDADERSNSILMIGKEEQLVVVEDLINTLDVQQQDLRTLRLYKIEFVDAEEVRNKLEEMGIISTRRDMRTSQRITGNLRPAGSMVPIANRPGTTRSALSSRYGDDSESRRDEPLIIVVEPSNSILVNATPEQHEQISTILKYVDSDITEHVIDYRIYPLENQAPTDLADTLTKLIQETVQDQENKIERVVKKTDDDIVIVPDENTFSLIVYAHQRNQTWIKKLINTLDKRRPQVLIDVTLVEVSKADAFDYDLNLIQSLPDLTATSGNTGALMGSAAANLVEALMSDDGKRDRFIDFQSNSGDGMGFYGDEHINLLIKAMQKKNYGRVLAKPKILVNDNQPGSISTQDTTYIQVVGGALPQEGSQVIQTSTSYQDYNAGITLDITPHISEGDLLRLDVSLTRSDFAGEIGGDTPPDQISTDISTVVTVPDKSTIILGGMIKLNQNKGGSKVPILGDIPLVGALFRGVSNSDIQKKLYVFVKAEIIRPSEVLAGSSDLERISDRNRLAFERHEAEFQNYQSWPGIPAKPMGPERVLDAQ